MSAVMKQAAAAARRDAAISQARAAFGGVVSRHAAYLAACQVAEAEYGHEMREEDDEVTINNMTAAEHVFALCALIADPQGSKARLDTITSAHAELARARSEHDAAAAAHEASKAELMKARSEHDAVLARARAVHDSECAARSRALDDREAKLATREADAKRAGELAAAKQAHFEKRAAALREAVN